MAAELPAVAPAPVPPDDRDAWYAPDIRSQYHIGQGVVATVTEAADGFHYRTREPFLSEPAERIRSDIEDRFGTTSPSKPLSREEAIERMAAGLPDRWMERIAGLEERSPAVRRRLEYHLAASLRAFGPLTPLALDARVQIGDTSGDGLTVHTQDFAPASTDLPVDSPALDRFLSERVDTRTITFESFEIPVTVLRRHLLGEDAFARMYAVREPDLLPGDEALIETVKSRLVESPPGEVLEDPPTHVIDRARTLLARRLRFRSPADGSTAVPKLFRDLGRWVGLVDPPLEPGTRDGRVDDLAYYVARDLVGDGELTVPIRDPRIRAVEASRVDERVTVVPHSDSAIGPDRMPTTQAVDDPETFIGLVRSIGAEGGVELSVHRPTATVAIERGSGGGTQKMDAAVSLPRSASGESHISITKQRVEPRSPIQLVDQGTLSAELVAAVWTIAANNGRVLFLGPPRADPTSVLEAHTPFIPADARPVGIEGPGSPIDLPHETAVTIPSRRSTGTASEDRAMDRVRTREALHPDVLVFGGVTSAEQLAELGSALASGRSIFAASRTEDRRRFVQRASAAGISPERVTAFDLVVELHGPGSDRQSAGWIPTQTRKSDLDDTTRPGSGTDRDISWEPVGDRQQSESHDLPAAVGRSLVDHPDASEELHEAYRRRVQYVKFLAENEMTGREELRGFLSDLRTDEAATIERIQRAPDG